MYQNIFITSRTEFEPSLIYLWDDEHGLIVSDFNDFSYAYKCDPRGEYTSIYGERLKKVNRYRWEEPGLYESDVPRETRVLSDLYLDSDMPSKGHRVACIDIEVSSEGGFATPETAENEITAIGIYSYVEDVYTVYLIDKAGQIDAIREGNERVLPFRSEGELIRAFMEEYSRLAPTILTGWNIDNYDIPYLYNRFSRVFGRDYAKKLSPVGLIRYNQNRMRYIIAGVSCLDYLSLYKKFTYNQQPSYRLDAIGKVEIGMGKVEYTGTLDMLFKSDIKKFIEYNLGDLKIVVGIDKKMKLIELARFICHIGHVPYEDYSYSSKFIEGTIITYLHRKGIIVANKPAGGREAFQQKVADDSEGFSGAFVKPPMPGLYDWVYSLDLQSLYPSIIMSLNISPDTKMGRVFDWDVDKYIKKEKPNYDVQLGAGQIQSMTREEFVAWIHQHQFSISSNGILYTNRKVGIIPEILDKWFAERVEYKNTMKKYIKEGNAEMADFYDRRQHVQKILLNSIYGVLGLSIFRFYDLDNALAVTATGQDVIKTTAKYINAQYKARGAKPKTDAWLNLYWEVVKKDEKKKAKQQNRTYIVPPRPQPEDHCLYIDTDSVYFSAKELMDGENPCVTMVDQKAFTIALAKEMEKGVNGFYNTMAKLLFNCDKHRFFIKGESVMETGLWVAKKRYAMKKVFDLETEKDMDKLAVKGIDVVRSSFPPAMRKFMNILLLEFLKKTPKDDVDRMVLNFRDTMHTLHYSEIARNTSVKSISEWDDPNVTSLHEFKSGCSAHVKAAITYNRLIRQLGLENKHVMIADGDKIKYTYLKKNPYGIEAVAVKNYDDPPEILALVERFIDPDALFEKELNNKLEDFYAALNWGILPTQVNQTAFEFFDFS
jgi:DNA polymerase elongation subunit (family B)